MVGFVEKFTFYHKRFVCQKNKFNVIKLNNIFQFQEEEEEEANADWCFMAMALDRACLFFYAFLSGIIPVWMFMSTPKPSWSPEIIQNLIIDSNITSVFK